MKSFKEGGHIAMNQKHNHKIGQSAKKQKTFFQGQIDLKTLNVN